MTSSLNHLPIYFMKYRYNYITVSNYKYTPHVENLQDYTVCKHTKYISLYAKYT